MNSDEGKPAGVDWGSTMPTDDPLSDEARFYEAHAKSCALLWRYLRAEHLPRHLCEELVVSFSEDTLSVSSVEED